MTDKWQTEGSGFNFASKDYPELEEILVERPPLARSKPSENRFKMHAAKTAGDKCPGSGQPMFSAPSVSATSGKVNTFWGCSVCGRNVSVTTKGLAPQHIAATHRQILKDADIYAEGNTWVMPNPEIADFLYGLADNVAPPGVHSSKTADLVYTITNNGRLGDQIRWFALGMSPAQLGTDPEDHERPKITNEYVNRNALEMAIANGSAFEAGNVITTEATYDKTTFDKTATWHDVQAKAARIRQEGGVRIISTEQPYIAAHVQGDNGIYETSLQRGPSGEIEMWKCSCPWDHYSFGRTGIWKKYEGRMCSHALATQYQAQSEGMFGGKVHEDGQGPEWDTGVTRYDPGKRVLRADSAKTAASIQSIRPPDYSERAQKTGWGDGYEPCQVCGRKVTDDKANMIEMHTNGSIIPEGDPESDGPNSQGWFCVGPECIKKVRALGTTAVARTIQPVAYLSPFVAAGGTGEHIDSVKPYRGMKFEHSREVLDRDENGDWIPDTGEVTAIRNGMVYYKNSSGYKSKQHVETFHKEVKRVLSSVSLKDKITNALSDDLRKPAYQGNCNPLTGHCYVASEAYYHMAGGRDAGLKPMFIRHEGEPHWFIRDGEGQNIDLTAGQFKTPVPYDQATGKGFLTAAPSARAKTLMDRVNGKTAALSNEVLDAVHLWTDIKVNLHGLSAEQLHNGFRYGWYMAQGDETDAALFAGAQRDPEFQRGERLANVLLAAVDANAIDCHHTLYRAIGLNDTHYPQVLTAAQSGSMTLQPASWSSERNLTNQFGIGQEGHYPHRVIFRLVPGSKAWSVGRASVTGPEREWVVTGGTFTVQDIDIPMIGDDIDRSVVITLSQNTVKTANTKTAWKDPEPVPIDQKLAPQSVTASLKRGGFQNGAPQASRVGRLPSYGFVVQNEQRNLYRSNGNIMGVKPTGAILVEHSHSSMPDSRTTQEHADMMLNKYHDHLLSEGYNSDHQGYKLRVIKKPKTTTASSFDDTLNDISDAILAPLPYDQYKPLLPPAHELYGGYIEQRRDGRLHIDGQDVSKLYRVVAPGEWEDAQSKGYLQSHENYTRASAKPDSRWKVPGGHILEIDYDPADDWGASAEGYASTHSRIPLSRVHKVGATHDVSKEKRDNSGEWTQGPAGSGAPKKAPKAGPVKEITKDQARGNSRPVSSQEFQSLADKGKSQLDALLADTRPAHAFEDDDKWKTIKTKAYQATRKSWGGQTINPATGNPVNPAKGYSISIRNPGQPTVAVAPDASRLEFNQAMDKAKADFAEQLVGSKTYLGVFKDDDNNVIDIDPVTIVETPEEVDSLGAYTHAVGGAYDFATGDGYFPPHVDPTKESKPKSDRVRVSPVVSDDDYKGADKVASDLTMANIPKPIQKKILARMTNDVGAAPDVAQANIVAQFERAPAELRDEYANWYYSAHDMSRKLGKENDISPHVVAAVIAAASAGASWYSQSGNKDVAQVTVEEASPANRTAPIDDERREWLNNRLTTERFVKDKQPDGSIVERSIGALTTWQIPKGASLQDVYDKIKGETEDTQNKILGMVIAHKYHFPTSYGYGNFGKSMRMALDNDPTKITTSIAGPKIRSFFNDIENPEGDDVTVDVHMWRSFTNTPASSRQDIAKQYIKLKKNTSKITGSPSYQGASVGAYPIAADVVRAAAKELNEKNGTHYTASQVQAVVWGQQKKEWGVGDIRKLPSIAKGAAVEDGASMHIPVYWGKEEPDDQVELWHLPGEEDDLPEDDDTLDELNLRREAGFKEESRSKTRPEATLHDDPEPALPSTDGELTDDELEPLKAGLAWLAPPEATVSHIGTDPNVDNAPPANPENAEIAAMAMATLEKMGVKTFTPAEQRELIEEGEDSPALNLASLNLEGSHYEQLEAELKKAEQSGEAILWW